MLIVPVVLRLFIVVYKYLCVVCVSVCMVLAAICLSIYMQLGTMYAVPCENDDTTSDKNVLVILLCVCAGLFFCFHSTT